MSVGHYDCPPVYGGMYYPTEYLHTPGIFMDEKQVKEELKREIEAEQKSASAKEKREKWIRQLKHMERVLEAMFVETKKLRSEIAKS
jgi:superfamily II helicase